MAQILADEWSEKRHGDVHLHKHLGAFFLDKFPAIRLAIDLETELRVRRLVDSGSFNATHSAISGLSGVRDLSPEQVRDLFDAAVSNDQVYRISRDTDVYDFFHGLVASNSGLFTEEELALFEAMFSTRGWDD
jgi:hypothetical protein